FAEIEDAQVALFSPPPVRGVGRAGGFTIVVEDRGDLTPKELQEYTEALVQKASAISITGKDLSAPTKDAGAQKAGEKKALATDAGEKKALATDAGAKKDTGEKKDAGEEKDAGEKEIETPALAGLFYVFRANVPQLKIVPDKAECMSKGVSLADFA